MSMRPRKYTDVQMLDAIRSAATRLGRAPYKGETVMSATAIVHRFGSWTRAIRLAGLTPSREPQRGGKRQHSTWKGVAVDRKGPSLLDLARRAAERAEANTLSKFSYWAARDPRAAGVA